MHYVEIEKRFIHMAPRGNPHYQLPKGFTRTLEKNKADRIMYSCPCCNDLMDKLEQLGPHLETNHSGLNESSKNDCEDDIVLDESDSEDELVPEPYTPGTIQLQIAETLHVSPRVTPLADSTNTSTTRGIKRRSYDDAVPYALKKQDKGSKEKIQALYITNSLDLRPLSIFDGQGYEENALANQDIINKLLSKHEIIQSIIPQKRHLDDVTDENKLCVKCIPKVHTTVENLIATSPYSNMLLQREFIRLEDNICGLMNKDLEVNPQIKYFTAIVLAGAIMINTKNNQAVMLNTIEVFGRTKTVDSHRESFGKLKSGIKTTSIPPPLKIPHHDVWPTVYNKGDGEKLVIGTQVSNVLVTSSIRLDQKLPPSVGGTTVHFQLPTIQHSLACQLFVDTESLASAMSMINNRSVNKVSNTGVIAQQFRQVRSNFHSPTTYSLCRASGPLTKSHTCQPYTIFTLNNHDRARISCAAIFKLIGLEVIQQGLDAKLQKSSVTAIANKATGKAKQIMTKILQLFEGDATTIPLLFNEGLNEQLSNLSNIILPSIVQANQG
ncbi:hypothetical protein DFQ28_001526, partial [Apophysomyces sp. BC1034]